MIIYFAYLIMGMMIGAILRYEVEMKEKRRKAEQRILYMKAKASEPNMQQYDEILNSIKSINESLSSISHNKHQKKEVH